MADQRENVLTDHAYDGIQEYDNPMPGWWVWSFILTIIFAFPYWAYFHLSGDRGIYAQLEDDMDRAAELAPKLDESEEAMLGYLDDPEVLARGEKVFQGSCAACHTADGGGLIGPNLTDEYYKNAKGIEDFVWIVRDGVDGTTMVANANLLSQQDIVKVAAYAASLRGTTPASPKEPEGEVIPAWR